MLVVDASAVVSALIGVDDDAEWACSTLLDGPLCAPHLMPVEVASVLRRSAGPRCEFRTPPAQSS